MPYMKSGLPWLYDDVTGDIVGVKDVDGDDSFFAIAKSDPITGRIEILGPNGLPMCPSDAIDVRAVGCKFDGKALYNVATTASASSVVTDTSASGVFVASDVGKVCAVIAAVASSPTVRYGQITAVVDANTVNVSLNGSPGVLTGATFVYGTDDRASLNTALGYAKLANRAIKLPDGIACVSGPITQPDGVSVYGVSNCRHGSQARKFRHIGTSVVLCGYTASHFWNAGDGSASGVIVGTKMQDFNVDGMTLCAHAIYSAYRNHNMIQVTGLRGSGRAFESGPGSETILCTFVSQQAAENVVQVAGDSRFMYNKVMGAGNGFYGIKVSNPSDVKIVGNHIWKDSDTPTALGGAVWVSLNSGVTDNGACQVIDNTFDTSFGPHFKLSVSAGAVCRTLNVSRNMSFQNSQVPANTYPWADFTAVASGTVHGLVMHGNTGRGAFDDTAFSDAATKGSYTYFIDANGMTGTINGSNVGGNTISDCFALYRNFTPYIDGGNVVITPAGVASKSTIA